MRKRGESEMRKSENKTTVNGGVGFFGLLTLAFIVLKLVGVITWSWVWVLSPIWITTLIFIAIVIWLVSW